MVDKEKARIDKITDIEELRDEQFQVGRQLIAHLEILRTTPWQPDCTVSKEHKRLEDLHWHIGSRIADLMPHVEDMVHVRIKDGTVCRMPESRWEQYLKDNPRYARKLQEQAEKLEKRLSRPYTAREHKQIHIRYIQMLSRKLAELKAENKDENNAKIAELEKELAETNRKK